MFALNTPFGSGTVKPINPILKTEIDLEGDYLIVAGEGGASPGLVSHSQGLFPLTLHVECVLCCLKLRLKPFKASMTNSPFSL